MKPNVQMNEIVSIFGVLKKHIVSEYPHLSL